MKLIIETERSRTLDKTALLWLKNIIDSSTVSFNRIDNRKAQSSFKMKPHQTTDDSFV